MTKEQAFAITDSQVRVRDPARPAAPPGRIHLVLIRQPVGF